jgi:Bifunctional DNA primase/polymerase, N-terminal
MNIDTHRRRAMPPALQSLTPLQAAVTYAQLGWHVLPLWWPVATGECGCGRSDCASVAKHPIWWLVPRGLHDASSRVATVAGWWRSVPHANVGIRTGAESRLVVLDVDGAAGGRSLRELVSAHGTFGARWARTGSGGLHAYFAHPGTPVPNSAGRLGDGLDVRGDGGYVVAPPSRHPTRHLYRWISTDDGGLPDMPSWLLELAVRAPVADCREVQLDGASTAAYAAAALEGECREVEQASPGRRNHRLNRAAFKLGQLVGAGLLEEDAVAIALVAAGLKAGPGERKIRSTVLRGLCAGKRHPRPVSVL